MSDTTRTSDVYEATAVSTRQWVGSRLASTTMFLTVAIALNLSLDLFLRKADLGSESNMLSHAWSYVLDDRDRVLGFAYPPILLWIGFAAFFVSRDNRAMYDHLSVALRKAWGKGRGKARRAAYPAARENLKRQLRERGHPYLFLGRLSVKLGFSLVGIGLVLVTALNAPSTVDLTSGQSIADTQKGLLPTVCLIGGLIALAGLLLSLPFGRSDKVVIDDAGNVRGTSEPIGSPVVTQPTTSETAMEGAAAPKTSTSAW